MYHKITIIIEYSVFNQHACTRLKLNPKLKRFCNYLPVQNYRITVQNYRITAQNYSTELRITAVRYRFFISQSHCPTPRIDRLDVNG